MNSKPVQPIMIVRIAHLLAYTDILQDAGAPLERELSKAGLPTMLEDKSDAYVPVLLVLQFLQRMERKEGSDDIGFLASQQLRFDHLSGDFIEMCQSVPSLFARLQLFSQFTSLENSNSRIFIYREGEDFRVCNNIVGYSGLNGLHYSEWLQISALVDIVRKSIGSRWKPSEITFQSKFSPCQDAYAKFPNTRFLFGQNNTSINVPASLMSRSLSHEENKSLLHQGSVSTPFSLVSPAEDYPSSLKLLLRSYIQQSYPDVNLAAEIASTSVRTLQRRLGQHGLNYTSLVQQARFEVAVDLLKDPCVKILDVAHAVGYSDPSHFARSFRCIAGVSPSEYRRQQL